VEPVTGLGPAWQCPRPTEHSDQPGDLVAARVRRGVRLPSGRIAGESDRQVHLFPVPAGRGIPSQLTALCGLAITPGMADLVTAITGMPCSACLTLGVRGATG
jgi:hypothetical protein